MRTPSRLVVLLCLGVAACTGRSDIVAPEPIESPVPPWQETEEPTPPPDAPAVDATIPPGDQRELRIHGPEGGEATFAVEVVADPDSRQQGLMHRTDLADDAGMLFLFPDEHSGGFWMRNTLIPLSIAFLASDGEILSIMDMEPCEADPCPTYDPGMPYTAALEVNQGAFDDAGVTTGWQVELDDDLPDPR